MSYMKVKILKKFRNPLTNRMAEINSQMNVPQALFWFKRIRDGDCEKAKKSKSKPAAKPAQRQDSKKGSR